jgi:hypothetical protein
MRRTFRWRWLVGTLERQFASALLSNMDFPWQTYEYLTRDSRVLEPERIHSGSASRVGLNSCISRLGYPGLKFLPDCKDSAQGTKISITWLTPTWCLQRRNRPSERQNGQSL